MDEVDRAVRDGTALHDMLRALSGRGNWDDFAFANDVTTGAFGVITLADELRALAERDEEEVVRIGQGLQQCLALVDALREQDLVRRPSTLRERIRFAFSR